MSASGRRQPLLIGGAIVVAVVMAVVVWWLRGDAPDTVDAGRALEQDRSEPGIGVLTPSEEVDDTSQSEPDNGPPTSPDDLTGTWTVDTSRTFDGTQGLGTFVGYRVDEELSGIGANTAVGRTPVVDGELVLDATRVVAARISADLMALESDDGRRDNRVRSMLGDGATAQFVLDDNIDFGEVPRVGEVVELSASGVLTIRDVAHHITVDLQAAVTERGLLITGTTVIVLDDFDVAVPSAGIVLSASDDATLEWQLFFRRAGSNAS
ncbi:MAG: YceI family protein [Nitriliruptoraceae bacterium]